MGLSTPPPEVDAAILQVPGPLGVLGTVRASLKLYAADAVTLWQVMALVVVPLQLVIFLLRVSTVPHGAILQNAKIAVPAGTASAFSLTSSVGGLLTFVVLLISVGAAYRILLGRYLHHPAGLSTSFSFALDRALPLLWVSVLVTAVTIIGLAFLIVPGIYFGIAYVLAVPVLMAEDRHGWDATERSRALVSGHWWHVLACTIVAGVVAVAGVLLISVLVSPIVSALSPHSVTGFLLIDGILSALISIVLSPFSAAVPVILYVDMLLRKDDPQLGRLLA